MYILYILIRDKYKVITNLLKMFFPQYIYCIITDEHGILKKTKNIYVGVPIKDNLNFVNNTVTHNT